MPKKQRAGKPERERRVYSLPIRVRSKGNKRTIYGFAAKFAPARSEDLGGFIEEIAPNAFDACLRSGPDVVGLWNHDANHVLGRTTSGTLRLNTTKAGLLYEIDPPATQLASDLMTLMERGDIHQSSFGFVCLEDSWRQENGQHIRTVLKADLFDVSPVTFPAYPDATSGVRGALRNAPAAVREAIKAKAKKRDEDDDSDDDDLRPECDPGSPDYDPLAADCDDEDDEELNALRLRLKVHQLLAKTSTR